MKVTCNQDTMSMEVHIKEKEMIFCERNMDFDKKMDNMKSYGWNCYFPWGVEVIVCYGFVVLKERVRSKLLSSGYDYDEQTEYFTKRDK